MVINISLPLLHKQAQHTHDLFYFITVQNIYINIKFCVKFMETFELGSHMSCSAIQSFTSQRP